MELRDKTLEDNDGVWRCIILLAYAKNEPIKDKNKLEKMMFLLFDKIDIIKEQHSYDADNYGVHSEIIEEKLQGLEQLGIVSRNSKEITITEAGKKVAKNIIKNEDIHVLRMIEEYKIFCNDLSSKELSAYVYLSYPDMTQESAEYENIKPTIESHIFSLIKKQKISAQRAAELLNKSQNYIIKKMKENGILVLG